MFLAKYSYLTCTRQKNRLESPSRLGSKRRVRYFGLAMSEGDEHHQSTNAYNNSKVPNGLDQWSRSLNWFNLKHDEWSTATYLLALV